MILNRWPTPKTVRLTGCGLFALLFAYCVFATAHWAVVWDQSVFHYIRFLMSRGFKPYADITDMNLPGCYLAEVAAMAVFGWSDAGWRVYEFFLFGVLALSGSVIGGRRAWFTGIFAATAFMLIILSQGESFALERDEVMAVLCAAGVAFFFGAVRSRSAWPLLPFALLTAFAATMKPSGFALQLGEMALLVVTYRRERKPILRPLLYVICGDLRIGALLAAFFVWTHSWYSFLYVVRNVWPLYTHTGTAGFGKLTSTLIPRALVPLVLLALFTAFQRRETGRWERAALWIGIASGALLYYTQLRPAAYHRAALAAFLALWIGWEFSTALAAKTDGRGVSLPSRSPGRSYGVALLGIAALFLGVVPYYIRTMVQTRNQPSIYRDFSGQLEDDLRALGGRQLQGQVECLDMVDGCLRSLYDLRLVQNTGSTGDMLLFSPEPSAATDFYRRWYTATQTRHPADVVVVSNGWYQSPNRTFAKLDTWPTYAESLRRDYVLVDERHPGGPVWMPSFRVYARRGSVALRSATAHGLTGAVQP